MIDARNLLFRRLQHGGDILIRCSGILQKRFDHPCFLLLFFRRQRHQVLAVTPQYKCNRIPAINLVDKVRGLVPSLGEEVSPQLRFDDYMFFAKQIAADVEKWKKVVAATGVKAE